MKSRFKLLSSILWNVFIMSLGSVLCAAAINGILIPHNFFGAGFTGISLILHYLVPDLPLSIIYFVINIPLFSFGWMYVGRRFFFYSILGMLTFSTAIDLIQISIPVYDEVPSAILGGILMGIGSGIILKSLGSAGGLDVLCVILLKRFSIRLGTTILVFNTIILCAGAALFTIEDALYTLIYIYVNAQVVNIAVTGLNQRKAIFVISTKWNEIASEIMEKIHRGVTVLQGWGAYTGNEQRILYTVITFRDLARLKPMVSKIDPRALLIVNETLEVMGNRIGNQPHW